MYALICTGCPASDDSCVAKSTSAGQVRCKSLQYDGVPAGEQRSHLVVAYLVGDLRTDSDRRR